MPIEPNSLAARDIETLIHPYTNLALHREKGPLILERGKGIYVWDRDGRRYIEALAGLWCTALGFGEAEVHQLDVPLVGEEDVVGRDVAVDDAQGFPVPGAHLVGVVQAVADAAEGADREVERQVGLQLGGGHQDL